MNKNFLLILLLLILSSCAASHIDISNCVDGKAAGFWQGLWHGIIAPVTFIFSLFDESIEIYSVHNNGNFYNLGFVLGAGILFGGSQTRRMKRRDR